MAVVVGAIPGGGFAVGAILGGVLAAPYYYGDPYYYSGFGYYYDPGGCGWVRVRVLRHGPCGSCAMVIVWCGAFGAADNVQIT